MPLSRAVTAATVFCFAADFTTFIFVLVLKGEDCGTGFNNTPRLAGTGFAATGFFTDVRFTAGDLFFLILDPGFLALGARFTTATGFFERDFTALRASGFAFGLRLTTFFTDFCAVVDFFVAGLGLVTFAALITFFTGTGLSRFLSPLAGDFLTDFATGFFSTFETSFLTDFTALLFAAVLEGDATVLGLTTFAATLPFSVGFFFADLLMIFAISFTPL